jgi:maleylpyruvate isomerase
MSTSSVSTLRLFTRYQNSAGERVRIVLNLKGLPYEYVALSSANWAHYEHLNPQGLMPALELDGQVVAQSMAILELVEELYPEPPMLPADPWQRAQARSFAHLISADLHPLNNNRVRKFLSGEFGVPDDGLARWYRRWVESGFDALEAMMRRRPEAWRFCFGDRPGLADACLVPQMANARRFGCPLAAYPTLVAIDAACRTLDAFTRAAPENQPDWPG